MKCKILMISLAAMLFSCSPALASEGETLPAVGDVVENFEVKEIRPYEAVDAQVVLFEHQSTGAQLMYIANDDTNRTFDLTFRTNAIDDTGLPHVFEHATLDGSEKYPSKALFFNLIYQTYNTYMNASTYDRMTTFPIASLSEAQLLKYADYYTDSCLHPTILEDESIFREEAWRYRMDSEDQPLTIEGTVYSEMLGAMTLQAQALYNFMTDAFPGSWIRYVSGGNPDVIPEMTYESLKAFHDRFYHPSNCLAYIYGDFEDYTAFLKLLDEAFSPYEKREFTITDEEYAPLEESADNTWTFPVETGSDTTYASSAYYGILMPGLTDEDELLKLDLLSSILSAQSSPLSQKMQTALPYAYINCYLELAGPDPVMVFSADYINAGDETVFRETVDSVLEDIAANGISKELADAVMNTRLLSSRIRREGDNVGVNLIAYVAYNDVLYDDPWSALVLEEYEEKILDWSQDGTFTKLVADFLTGDQPHVLTMTNPQPGAKEEKDAALAKKLEEIKAGMSEEEKAEIIEASNAADEMDDASVYVRELQGVDVDTLPEEIPAYDISDETDETGIRRVQTTAQVSGVGIVEILLDASSLSMEQLRWMRLLTELQDFLDSETHTRDELAILQDQYFYNGSISYEILQVEDKLKPYYTMSWISLTDCLKEGYDLAYELAFEQALDEEHCQQVQDALQALVANQKNGIIQSPYSVTIYKGLARGSKLAAFSDSIGNLNYYNFLQETLAAFEEDPAAVMENLIEIRELLGTRTGAIAVYAGDEESIEENRSLSETFFERLNDTVPAETEYEFDSYPNSYAMIVDSSVYYNGYTADYETLGLDGYNAGLTVAASLVTDQFLYPLLRDQYGAYGVFNSASEEMGYYMLSYRDPNLEETYAVYEQVPELLRSYPLDQEIINGYILSAYSQVALSPGELSGALSALDDYLNGKDPMRKLEWMEQMKAVTPETIMEYSSLYENLVAKGVRISTGGSSQIRENSDMFEEIEAPFETDAQEAEEITEAWMETEEMMEEADTELDEAA